VASDADYESETGRAYLSKEYAGWIERGDHWLADLVCLRPEAATKPPRIISPTNGSVLFLDPDLRDGGRRLVLQAQAGSAVQWSSSTLRIELLGERAFAWLELGRHEIVATDADTGLQSAVTIEVCGTDARDRARVSTGSSAQ